MKNSDFDQFLFGFWIASIMPKVFYTKNFLVGLQIFFFNLIENLSFGHLGFF